MLAHTPMDERSHPLEADDELVVLVGHSPYPYDLLHFDAFGVSLLGSLPPTAKIKHR